MRAREKRIVYELQARKEKKERKNRNQKRERESRI